MNGAENHIVLQSINAIADLSATCELPLSGQKPQVFFLGERDNRNNYHLGKYQFNGVPSLRDLGFILDTNISSKELCEFAAKKADGFGHSLLKSLRTNSVVDLVLANMS